MPELLNVKHEMFAQKLALGMSQKQAYIEAGYVPTATSNASNVARRPDIRARVKELVDSKVASDVQGTHHERMLRPDVVTVGDEMTADEITVDWVIEKLIENAREASVGRQYAAANKALSLIAELKGFFIDADDLKRNREKEEEDAKKEGAKKALVPIDKLNKLLEKKGFKGTIDLADLDRVDAPKLPVEGSPST